MGKEKEWLQIWVYDDEDTVGVSIPCGGRVPGVGRKEAEGGYQPRDDTVLAEGYERR